jgi:hypothetical protein
MRTIEIYKFNELSEESKKIAIEEVRKSYYEYNDFAQWAIDDCALFEPSEAEMKTLFGEEYKFPLLKNNRKNLYFSFERDRFIDISKALEITNEEQFLKWLGIDVKKFTNVEGFRVFDYAIYEGIIEFDTTHWSIEFTKEQAEILEKATAKFENHCQDILKRIETAYDYRFTDESILQDIESNSYEFFENGTLYN